MDRCSLVRWQVLRVPAQEWVLCGGVIVYPVSSVIKPLHLEENSLKHRLLKERRRNGWSMRGDTFNPTEKLRGVIETGKIHWRPPASSICNQKGLLTLSDKLSCTEDAQTSHQADCSQAAWTRPDKTSCLEQVVRGLKDISHLPLSCNQAVLGSPCLQLHSPSPAPGMQLPLSPLCFCK